jgi:formylglycine-generating enzyme required for sulfatase activity
MSPIRSLGAFAAVIVSLVLFFGSASLAVDPAVSNVRALQRPGTKLLDIRYDVADPDTASLDVTVQFSIDDGLTFASVTPMSLSNGRSNVVSVGSGVAPGTNHWIVWDAGAGWNRRMSDQLRIMVTAWDEPVPEGMVRIPPGPFQMGDNFGEGGGEERPVHIVTLTGFYMDRYEVTKAKWDEVANWASVHGYDISAGSGSGKAPNHPVHSVNWYTCVKWCNARSEMQGLTPAYYTSLDQSTVYRTGRWDVQERWVRWDSGYRLPTEAEWEKAARGGAALRRFPWGDADTVSHSRANYNASGGEAYDLSNRLGYHDTYETGGQPCTSPVGAFELGKNGYGLYDMAGNVWEWCWDWYGSSYYGSSPGVDPRGPSSAWCRVLRGGSWSYIANFCRVASRRDGEQDLSYDWRGFRTVLPPDRQ